MKEQFSVPHIFPGGCSKASRIFLTNRLAHVIKRDFPLLLIKGTKLYYYTIISYTINYTITNFASMPELFEFRNLI